MDKNDSLLLPFWEEKALSVDQDAVFIVEENQILAVVVLI